MCGSMELEGKILVSRVEREGTILVSRVETRGKSKCGSMELEKL
jgi:hypothetical protein